MDLIEKLQELGSRVSKMKDQVLTEEATKTAFIMPFLNALGYDIFNPMEVVPEFVADIGTKKGEKVDYCVLMEGQPSIIIEAKHWKEPLDVHKSQLHRYFHVTSAKFGVLTNGVVYRIYTDLEESNKMDDKPFFEFSIEAITEQIAYELKKFQKSQFDAETIYETASELRYSKEIKELLALELKNPSEEFIYYFASKIYPGKVTSKIREQFTPLVAKSFKDLLSEMISNRLKSALVSEEQSQVEEPEQPQTESEDQPKSGVITTEEELQGFRIVVAILARKIDPNRITHRDTKSYMGVLVDDNNRKAICRLHFNSDSKKYIGLFDENKKEERVQIESVNDIYKYEARLIETLERFL